jgi:dihydroflavonol-4-reductase
MKNLSVVTGANGHLGNNLVRVLLEKGEAVMAGTRRGNRDQALAGLGCRIARLDLADPDSLERGFADAQTVYLVGAVFKHWARDPVKEIYDANMAATRHALDAAAKCGVKRIVYVSSLAATDRLHRPITEAGWNSNVSNTYFRSKNDSERLAWQLASRHGLEMVSVLPAAMIGGHCYRLTPTMELLQIVLDGKLDVDPGFWFNFIDVRDVAEGCWLAGTRGRAGERYLLANENCTSIKELAATARALFPERKIPVPRVPPKVLAWVVAAVAEAWSSLRGTPPALQRNFLNAFSVQEQCDITKARRELGFNPRPPLATIERTLRHLVTGPSTPGDADMGIA